MVYAETRSKIDTIRRNISELRGELRTLQEAIEPQEVSNYAFSTSSGTVTLSELFGDRDTLFVIHNMGASCPYCTLWADGFNGVLGHLQNRAAFVMSSPDAPDAQAKFAASRGWSFRMVSHEGSSFAEDMGYKAGEGWMPGVSVFKRDGDKLLRVSDTHFGPGDDFCGVWHLLDLIPEGSDGWQPKYKYG